MEYKQAELLTIRGTCQLQFWGMFQFSSPQIRQIEDKNDLIVLKKSIFSCVMESGQLYDEPQLPRPW